MGTELIVRPQTGDTGMDAMTLGQTLAKSGYFSDVRDAAQAVVKILAGQELGIGPIAAMTGIYIVKGRVTMSANLMAAQIKRSGRYNYTVAEMTDERVDLVFFESHGAQRIELGHSVFTKQDAQNAGLWASSEPWKKTPRNMLFARAMSNGVKWYTPDIFSGPVYTAEELQQDEAPPAQQPLPALPAPRRQVDVTTGEITEEPQELPSNGTLRGIASTVEAAYTKTGELMMKFVLTLDGGATETVVMHNAPDAIAQMEDGDPVAVTGEFKKFKGKEVFWADLIEHAHGKDADGQSVWDERAAESATFTPVEEPAL